ncbi:MAG: TonB-dependent receptor [Candidatus Eisenbacteria bacterium]|uniref:TonB-dependent receptor n=1 Tax=Eiseniibacteriota bacterium TaxID=2212470 RepID=A0A956NJ20_UNCEI|nr:TonB-dependent receptor [Candidatus Eisenbacteria bacterium]
MRTSHALVGWIIGTVSCWSASAASEVADLSNLSIEELMRVEVTSVSRQEEHWLDAAAAVTVITADDMRRAGVLSVPEALRMAPGIDVAQIDANKWAVSARGFLGRFSNKLLVLMDGRSIYTPFFGGVEWDMVDLSLDDIDRIEVIRGPGASLWGSNAVNGVINIITRRATADDGMTLSAATGSNGGLAEARLSTQLAPGMDLRMTTLYRDRSASPAVGDFILSDAAETVQAQARWDYTLSPDTDLSLQARYGDGDAGTSQLRFATGTIPLQTLDVDYQTHNGSLHGRAVHRFGETGHVSFAGYWTEDSRNYGVIDYSSSTKDLEVESGWTLHSHEFVVGLGQRWITDQVESTPWLVFEASQADHDIFSGFAQDQFPLFSPKLTATAGLKFEDNSYSSAGVEWQPNARLLWKATEHHRLWASAARAIRTPSLIDNDGRFLVYSTEAEGLPVEVWATGSEGFRSEELVAFELGYRSQPRPDLSLDLSTFVNEYSDLRGSEIGEPSFKTDPIRIETELQLVNNVEITVRGIEAELRWDPTDRLRLVSGASYARYDNPVDAKETTGANLVTQSEYHVVPFKLNLRALYDLNSQWQLDSALYYVDDIETLQVDSYARLDLRLGWRPVSNIQASIGVQNLLEDQHEEFASWNWELAQEVQRNIYGRFTWGF